MIGKFENKSTIFDRAEYVKPYTYPHLIEYMNAIHQSFWIPEHFSFSGDMADYKTKLSDHEREAVKRAMLAISFVENKVKTFWSRLDMRMPKTEISLVGAAFGNSEAIHQVTYAKLLELLGLDNEFANINDIPVMKNRGKYLSKYLSGITSRSNKEFTKSLMLFTFLVENCSLFSQFLIVSSFRKYKNQLVNFNSVIGATAREECYIDGTEVLTPRGWVDLKDINRGDVVYQYNEDSTIEAVKTTAITNRHHSGYMYSFGSSGHGCTVTTNHDMVYYNPQGELLKEKAFDFKVNSNRFIPYSGELRTNFSPIKLSPDDRVRIAIMANGQKDYNKGYYVVYLRDESQIKYMESKILPTLSESYEYEDVERGGRKYFINYEVENLSDLYWVNLSDKTSSWCREFIEEISIWNTRRDKNSDFGYRSKSEFNVGIVQTAAILAGYRTEILTLEGSGLVDFETYYVLSIFNEPFIKESLSLRKNKFKYEGMVRCVTVPSGVIITRYKNETFIAGNCIHAEFGEDLIKIIQKEFPEWFDDEMESKIRRNIDRAFKAECEILDWIFEEGELDFLPKQAIIEYLKYRFNKGLNAIGYESQFEVDEKLLKYSDFLEVQLTATSSFDFFNEKSTDYSSGSSFDEDEIW